jgi:hypothetical protein
MGAIGSVSLKTVAMVQLRTLGSRHNQRKMKTPVNHVRERGRMPVNVFFAPFFFEYSTFEMSWEQAVQLAMEHGTPQTDTQ